MSEVKLKGGAVQLEGSLPTVGASAPDFVLVSSDLSEFSLKNFDGKVKILATVPSIDTSTCAQESREFHKRAGNLNNTAVIVASGDLPFAMGRFCAAEGIDNLVTGSHFRNMDFARHYGVGIKTGPLKGLSARALFVLDRDNRVSYVELVPEITAEPDYDKAIEAAQKLS